jgi:hypothetical protein
LPALEYIERQLFYIVQRQQRNTGVLLKQGDTLWQRMKALEQEERLLFEVLGLQFSKGSKNWHLDCNRIEMGMSR